MFQGSIGDLVLVSDSVAFVSPEDVLLYTEFKMSPVAAALHSALSSLDGLVRRLFGKHSLLYAVSFALLSIAHALISLHHSSLVILVKL